MYSFKCGHDIKNKLKGVSKSQTKHIKFEEFKKRLDGKEYKRECIIKFFVIITMKSIFKK